MRRALAVVWVCLAFAACGENDAPPPPTASPTLPPLWRGRTLEEWRTLLGSDVRALRFDAIWALGELGPPTPEAVTALRAALGPEGDPDLAYAAAFVVSRWRASAPAELAPALLATKRWRTLQARALAEMGPQVVPALRAVLTAPQDEPKGRALTVLSHLGPEGEPLAGEVVRVAVEQASPELRKQAARVLGRLGAAGAEAAIRLLASEDLNLADAAGQGLARAGDVAMPSLRAALKGPGVEAPYVAGVLADMGPAALPALPELLEALRRNGTVRFNSADALVAIGDPARPGLEAMAKDPDPDVAALAADALERLSKR